MSTSCVHYIRPFTYIISCHPPRALQKKCYSYFTDEKTDLEKGYVLSKIMKPSKLGVCPPQTHSLNHCSSLPLYKNFKLSI